MPLLNKSQGFTLIEILIVLVIISITAGVAVMTVSFNQHKKIETLTQQIVNLFNLAKQEAMLRPAVLGFAVTKQGFQFYELKHQMNTNKNRWVVLNTGVLKPHHIANNVTLTLNIQDQTVPLQQIKLFILPSGDITPFLLFIGKKKQTPDYQITGKMNGEIQSEPFAAP